MQVDVPGSRPSGRFGAGIELDLTNYYLYIIVSLCELARRRKTESEQGGTGYTSGVGFVDYGDLYVFQLTDAFYKRCSATGQALTSAIAGVNAIFYLQCQVSEGCECREAAVRSLAGQLRTTSGRSQVRRRDLRHKPAQHFPFGRQPGQRAVSLRLHARGDRNLQAEHLRGERRLNLPGPHLRIR